MNKELNNVTLYKIALFIYVAYSELYLLTSFNEYIKDFRLPVMVAVVALLF